MAKAKDWLVAGLVLLLGAAGGDAEAASTRASSPRQPPNPRAELAVLALLGLVVALLRSRSSSSTRSTASPRRRSSSASRSGSRSLFLAAALDRHRARSSSPDEELAEQYPPPEHPRRAGGDRAARRGGRSTASRAGGCCKLGLLGARRDARRSRRSRPALSFGPLFRIEAVLRDAVAARPPARRRGRQAVQRRRTSRRGVLHGVPRGRRQGAARPRRSSSCGCRTAQLAAARRAAGLRRGRHRRVLEDLHARRLRDLDVPRAALPAGRAAARARVPVPLLDVRSRDRRHRARSGPAGRACRCCRSRSTRKGYLRAKGNFNEPGRAVVVGRAQSEGRPAVIRDGRPLRRPAQRRARRSCARRCATSSPTTGRSCSARSRSTRSCVLVATGIYLTFFFVDSTHEVVYHGTYPPLQGQHMSEAYRSVRRHLARREGGAADPADAPLGGERLPRLDHPAPLPRLLHRRVPEAARADVLPRRDDARARAARGVHRLLARRRPDVGDGPRRSATRSGCRSRSSARTSWRGSSAARFPAREPVAAAVHRARVPVFPILIGTLLAAHLAARRAEAPHAVQAAQRETEQARRRRADVARPGATLARR